MFVRFTWKRPSSQSKGLSPLAPTQLVHFSHNGLAQALYRIYLKMFESEKLPEVFPALGLQTVSKPPLPMYHRASYASFLRLVKDRVTADWDRTMTNLLTLIEGSHDLFEGMSYIQELYLHMHLLGVFSIDSLRKSYNLGTIATPSGDLRDWREAQSAVCVTLKVPRTKLAVFTNDDPTVVGSPQIHCIVQSSSANPNGAWRHVFEVVQIGFGRLSTSGARHSDTYTVQIAEEPRGWHGTTPLFVSFMAPTRMLLLESQTARIIFGVQNTRYNTGKFIKRLGPSLNVYETTLGNAEHVYISKDMPNQDGFMSIQGFANEDNGASGLLNPCVKTTITANVDTSTGKIVSFTGRLDLRSNNLKSALRSGCHIQPTALSAFDFAVSVGKVVPLKLSFPAPVAESRCTTRIARKSSYIEFIAPMDIEAWKMSLALAYPVFLNGRTPAVWNMPYINLRNLPILDTSRQDNPQWLITHASLMFSARERTLRADPQAPRLKVERTRYDFKDSLFSIFMHFTALQEAKRENVFGICNPTGGGVHIIIFVSNLRLDLATRAVVLDAAVLLLHDELMPKVRKLLVALTKRKVCSIKVDKAELRLWKRILPAMVERCRTWEHLPRCEYATQGRIPLSVENGEPTLCQCGNGVVPDNFVADVPGWDSVAKYVVRVAISPFFSCPLADEVYEGDVGGFASAMAGGCRVCKSGTSEGGGDLLTCARCHKAKYCSRECQRADWTKHKAQCAALAAK